MKTREMALIKHRYTGGKIGMGLRYAILKSISNHVGENVAISQGVYMLNTQNISIGNNVSIHPMSYLEGLGGINIGNDVSIAHGVTIMSTSHSYNDDPNCKIREQAGKEAVVTIEDNVWIGAKATILSGVTIGGTGVIGAGAIVLKSTERNSVYVGVPAKRVKQIDSQSNTRRDEANQ